MVNLFLDFDGVFCDSETYFKDLEPKFFSKLILKNSKEDFNQFTGRNYQFIFDSLKKNYGLKINFEKFEEEYLKLCDHVYYDLSKPELQINELLKFASKNNFKIALVSSSNRKYIDYILKKFNLDNYIDIIVSIEDVGKKPKPHSYPYKLALKKLGQKQGYCVEDSESGIESAKKAGLYVYGYKKKHTLIDKYVNNIKEIINDLKIIIKNN